jgi:hypothetical protein
MHFYLKSFLLVFLILANILTIKSQVFGKLTDKNSGKPIPYANVVAIDAKDSSIVKANLTDDNGKFEFNELDEGIAYRLKTIMLGYADYFSEEFTFQKNNAQTINCKINVASKELEGFELVEKVPFLEQQAGKMIVNVADNITNVNGSMMDIMKKVPGVMVVNKKLSLAGNQNVTILINGKSTQYLDMQTLLRELPAEDIEKIEVVSQPDATMDATGSSGVINIILKKNRLSGTNGSIRSGFGYGKIEKYSFGGSINHRKEKLNVYAAAGYSYNTSFENTILTRRVATDTYNQNTYEPDYPKNYRFSGGIDYDLSEKQMIGLTYRHVQSTNNRINENNTSVRDSNNVLTDNLLTLNHINRKWNYNAAEVYYNFDIDSLGQKFTFSTNVGAYNNNASSEIITNSNFSVFYPEQRNNEPANTQILASKIDYLLPLGKKWKFGTGVKYSYANVDSDLQAEINNGNGYENNLALSNHYIFKEKIYAGYIKQEFNTKKISFQTGLRYENSISDGYSVTIDSTRSREISKLFPSAGLSIPITKVLGISTSYSYRIQRPSYSTLNSFISYLDPYTYEKGNTNLRPELTHSTKFSLTYENQPFFNLEHNRTNDVLMFVTEQDDATGVSYATTTNLEKYDKYGASLFFPLDFIKPLEGYGGIMTYYHKYDAPYLSSVYNREIFSYILFIEASAEVVKTLTLEASGWYNSKGFEGIMEHNPLYGVSFGAEKTFFDEILSINVSYDDAFFKYFTADIVYQNMDIDIESRWETRVINFAVSYKFGNRFVKNRKYRQNSAQEELNRANQK